MLLLCVIGGFTKMDKVYFLWLQKIASLSDKFNAKVYDKIKQCIKNIYYNNYKDTDELKEIGISDSIINIILDKNIPYYYNLYGEYGDDWLHFLPFDEKQFREQLVFNEFFPVLNMDRISHYIKLILYENTYANKIYQKENVSFLMQAMLNNLIVMQREKDLFSSSVIYQEQLKKLRLKIRNTPYINLL